MVIAPFLCFFPLFFPLLLCWWCSSKLCHHRFFLFRLLLMDRLRKVYKGNLLTGLDLGLQLGHAGSVVEDAVELVVVLLQAVLGGPEGVAPGEKAGQLGKGVLVYIVAG